MAEVRRSLPATLAELKAIVEVFAESLEEEEVTNATRGIMKRARACRAVGGAAFEYKLKKNPEVFGGNRGGIMKCPIISYRKLVRDPENICIG